MKLSERDMHILILGVAFVALGGYVAISRTSDVGNPGGKSPARETAKASLNLSLASMSANVNMLGIDVQGGLTPETKLIHFFNPNGGLPVNPPNQQYTHTKHRYPTVSGSNISTLIHKGYSPLMVPSERDYEWMVNPPSESYFGG